MRSTAHPSRRPAPALVSVTLGACLALAPLALGACDERSPTEPPPGLCTEVGCEDGLTIYVTNVARDTRYDVVITTPDETRECSIDTTEPGTTWTDCEETVILTGEDPDLYLSYQGIPETLTIAVTVPDSDLSLAETFTPAYMEFAPNGRDCGPICLRAGVDLALP